MLLAIMDIGRTFDVKKKARKHGRKWQYRVFVSKEKLDRFMTKVVRIHWLKYSVPVTRGYTYVHTVALPDDAIPDSIDIERLRRDSIKERAHMSVWMKKHGVHIKKDLFSSSRQQAYQSVKPRSMPVSQGCARARAGVRQRIAT